MAKFLKPTVFQTGRTSYGTFRTGVAISDQLIIEACENGSGGVGRWRTLVANRVQRTATGMAELGDELDHYDHWHGYEPGCYKKSFKVQRRGGLSGKGHFRRAVIYNDCPHALFAEAGRNPSGQFEVFTTRRSVLASLFGNRRRSDYLIYMTEGTNGFGGKRVLNLAWQEVLATTNTFGFKGRNLSALASFDRLNL